MTIDIVLVENLSNVAIIIMIFTLSNEQCSNHLLIFTGTLGITYSSPATSSDVVIVSTVVFRCPQRLSRLHGIRVALSSRIVSTVEQYKVITFPLAAMTDTRSYYKYHYLIWS